MNKSLLTGRLVKDLELRKTQSGTSVISFTLAVKKRFKQEGEHDADFIQCTAWGKTAETMHQYLRKGSLIGVEGRITTGTYQDKDGRTVYTTDVTVENFDFLESRDSTYKGTQFSPEPTTNGYGEASNTSSIVDDFGNDTLDIDSDSLPF